MYVLNKILAISFGIIIWLFLVTTLFFVIIIPIMSGMTGGGSVPVFLIIIIISLIFLSFVSYTLTTGTIKILNEPKSYKPKIIVSILAVSNIPWCS